MRHRVDLVGVLVYIKMASTLKIFMMGGRRRHTRSSFGTKEILK